MSDLVHPVPPDFAARIGHAESASILPTTTAIATSTSIWGQVHTRFCRLERPRGNIVEGQTGGFGDISTLANPAVVDLLVAARGAK